MCTEYKTVDPDDTTQINYIEELIKTQVIGTIILELDDDTGNIHKLSLKMSTTSLRH